ncbi:MAG: peptidylprolyl isomerase [Bacteroidales bacterium]|jgi:peptidyl-prolyl cis-trans isomerase SurA|nr:peptidylprolyl isomerase [Bacteroidales bacterium]
MKIKLVLIGLLLCSTAYAQNRIMIDQVVAVVGNRIVKHSDIEAQISNMRMQGEPVDESTYCRILERMMINRLFEHQADLDSIIIPDSEVEAELDRRIRFFIQQIGSREKLEEFYNKPIVAIKEEFREMIHTQMISGQMERRITEDVRVTPSEVRKFFNQLNPDSIPLIPTEFEIYQIVKKPAISKEQRDEVRRRLNEYRNRILRGERFSTLATLFSECPASSRRGGELGFFGRGEMYAEFESAAFSLKDGEISPVIETKAGFHILQLIERQGEIVNVRHLLLQPKPDIEDLDRAHKFLDSIAGLIRDSVYTFQEAAERFSDDPSGKVGGLYTGPYGNSRVMAEEMDPSIFFIIDKFEEGQISNAAPFLTEDNEQAFRLLMLNRRIAPHRANLEQDYDKIHNMALSQARQARMSEWLNQKLRTLYVRLNDRARACSDTFEYNWAQ